MQHSLKSSNNTNRSSNEQSALWEGKDNVSSKDTAIYIYINSYTETQSIQ